LALDAIAFASKQGADVQRQLAMLVLASIEGRLSSEISETPSRLRPVISLGAELVLDNLENLTDDARDVVNQEASTRPERWQQAIRLVLPKHLQHPARLQAARLLDKVGAKSDVPLLRLIGRETHRAIGDKSLGRELARKLAPRVTVMDLGRVRISIGSEELVGGGIRRKVLALICYLLTRPQFTATREEVMDSLWPEIDPDAAANSLNQTMYFLRRVFEPDYDEDLSPGYLRQEGDLVLLDRGLVTSASSQCAALIARIGREPDPALVNQLSGSYAGRFASDFAYEEWAVDFRDWLHVAYLQIIEDAIASDIAAGKFGRGVGLARRALEMEPRLESLGLSLLRLLKGTGAHAAAAEQYERYAALLRTEIGIEASPYDSI
jgi:DNA-binding SARP family transcriptional activator